MPAHVHSIESLPVAHVIPEPRRPRWEGGVGKPGVWNETVCAPSIIVTVGFILTAERVETQWGWMLKVVSSEQQKHPPGLQWGCHNPGTPQWRDFQCFMNESGVLLLRNLEPYRKAIPPTQLRLLPSAQAENP